MPSHCLEDLLNDSAQFIRTRQGGQKKKYNTEKIWIYELVWMNKNDPRIKSDDVEGRSKVYNAIVKGEDLPPFGVPESFNVLIKELQGLGLDIELD